METNSKTDPHQATPPAPLEVFDQAASLDQTGGDPGLLNQLVTVFLEQLPSLLPPLATAVQRRDGTAVRKAAHALASSISVLSAPLPCAAARRLERMGLNSELDSMEQAHAEVLHHLALLRQALAASIATKKP